MLGKLAALVGKGAQAKTLGIIGVTAFVATSVVVTSTIVNNADATDSLHEVSARRESDSPSGANVQTREEEDLAYLTGDLNIEKIPPPPPFERTKEYRLPMKVEQAPPAESEQKSEEKATFVYPSFENQGDPWDLFTSFTDGSERENLSKLVEDSKISGFRNTNEQYANPPMIDAFTWSPEQSKLYLVSQFHAGYPVKYHRFYYEISTEDGEKKLIAERSGGYGRSNDREAYTKEMEEVFAFQQQHPHLADLENKLTNHLISPDKQNRLSLITISGLSFLQLKSNTDAVLTYQPSGSRSGLGRDSGKVLELPFRLTDRESRNDNIVISDPGSYAAWSPDGRWIAVRSANDQKLIVVDKEFGTAKLYFEDTTVNTIKEWFGTQPLSWDEGEQAFKTLKYGSGNYFDNMRDLQLTFVTEGEDVYLQVGQATAPLKWSPDGKYLAFYTIRFVEENKWSNDVVVLRLSDGKCVRINHHNFCSARKEHRFDLNYSPDGSSIAFVLSRCGDKPENAHVVMGWGLYTAKLEQLFAGDDEFGICKFIREIATDDPMIEYTGVQAGYTTSFAWLGEGKKEERAGFELVVPADSESNSELASIKYRHDARERDLESAVKEWQTKKDEETLEKIRGLRFDISLSEKDFFENATQAIDDFKWEEMDRQMAAFRDRVIQPQRETTAAYDTLGKYDYGTYIRSYSQYSREERIYRYLQQQLLTTLNLWNAYNATLIKHHGMKARAIEVELRRHGLPGDPGEHLQAVCGRLAAIQLDQGERGLIQQQIMQEATFLAQRSYFYGFRATRDAHEKIEPTTTKQAVEELFFKNGKYFVTATTGIWSGAIDLLKVTYVPETIREWIGLETLAEKTDKEIVKLRKTTADKIATLDRMRGFSREQFLELRHYLREEGGFSPVLEAQLNALRDDRNFHEETDGGLYRVAGAFDTTLVDKLTTEYMSASRHGELSLADMQKSLNKQIGLEESGDFTFKIFLDPMKFVESSAKRSRLGPAVGSARLRAGQP